MGLAARLTHGASNPHNGRPALLAQYWFCEKMGHSPVFNAALWRFASLPHYDGTVE